MRKGKFLSALALTLIAGASMAQSAATPLPSSLWFDGYCDGISGISKVGSLYIGTYDQTPCGTGFTTAVGGPAGMKLRGGKLTTGGGVFAMDQGAVLYGITYMFIANTNNTFSIVDAYGNVYLDGTWTTGAARIQGTQPAISRK